MDNNNGEIKPFGVPLYKDGPITKFRNKKNLSSMESNSIEEMKYIFDYITEGYNPQGGTSLIESDGKWAITKYFAKAEHATNIYVQYENYTEIPEKLYTFLMELVVKNREYFFRPLISFDMLENIIEHILIHYKQNQFDAIRNLMQDEVTLEYISNSPMDYYIDYSEIYVDEPINKYLIIWFKNYFLSSFVNQYLDVAFLIYKKEIGNPNRNYEFLNQDFYFDCRLEKYCNISDYKYIGISFSSSSILYSRAVSFALNTRKTYADTISMGYDTFMLLTDDTITFRGKTLYRVKYLKEVSYLVDNVLHEVKPGDLGGYVSDLSFVHENVIIKEGAKVMPFSHISAGVIIDKAVVINCNVAIFKHCFLVNKSNISIFKKNRLSIDEKEIKHLRRQHVALPFIYPKPKAVVKVPPEQLSLF